MLFVWGDGVVLIALSEELAETKNLLCMEKGRFA